MADLSRWPLGPGILALKDGAASVYFNSECSRRDTDRFCRAWAVQPSERLLSTTLLQVPQTVLPGAAPVFSNYILAATNTGRILSKAATTPAATQQVFYASPQPAIAIDKNTWGPCTGGVSGCVIGVATLTAGNGKKIGEKDVNGTKGLGVVGGSAGNEIDIGEQLNVQLPKATRLRHYRSCSSSTARSSVTIRSRRRSRRRTRRPTRRTPIRSPRPQKTPRFGPVRARYRTAAPRRAVARVAS